MTLPFHPSLKRIVKGSSEWLALENKKNKSEKLIEELNQFIDSEEQIDGKANLRIQFLASYYGTASCDSLVREDAYDLCRHLNYYVVFYSLCFRWDAVYSELRQDLGNWPEEFRESLRAACPIILSKWEITKICAVCFIEMVEKDQRVNTALGSRRIKHGTSDVFLIYLFSQSFDLKTSFTPTKPLIPEYKNLLDCWRTTDESAFKQAMQVAADFHISRSKDSTNSKLYEFEDNFDRMFPVELLAIQALRRRDGLPAFETGHTLIDTPWAMIKDLPEVEPHPLAVTIEARLKKDYPTFR